jgi:hypothetical protein
MLHFLFTLCYILDIHKHKCKNKMVGIFLHIIFINCLFCYGIPNQHDSIWIEPEKVLYVLSEPPAKIGSRERSMKIVDTDFENIEKIFV